MKHFKNILPALLLLVIAIPGFSNEAPATVNNTAPNETTARVEVLTKRLEEIRSMDVESMSRKDKRVLRKEVRSIEKEMKQLNNNGVYISVGGIIIILLLLILLL